MIDVRAMWKFATDEGSPGPYSCAACVAAGLPDGSRLAEAMRVFHKSPFPFKVRALRNPLAAARLVARATGAKRVRDFNSPAWGVVDSGAGSPSFAVFDGHKWFARSWMGIVFVHPTRVIAAWGVL